MGKKGKVGKSRKDKFYHLAKETGYRARSAFKLIQLNRKFAFLQESRVLIDLCAAPGGWLQVASNFMPMSSVIIGIDLVPIKPIKNVTTIQADITTDKCRQLVRKELKTWSADVVLNDGAPNVGAAWVQDAFSQAQLALSALKLASEHLKRGGWFITKVFRSKDYTALLWVFQQLFKKVHATKPQASRNESAEIFVVCQGYLKPDKMDERFLDPKYVFKEIQQDSKIRLNILKPEKVTRQREGYPENNITLHTTITDKEFITSSDAVEILSTTNKIIIQDEKIIEHKATTNEVKACCEDIKVLGRRELKLLFTWRKKIRKDFKLEKEESKENIAVEEIEKTEDEKQQDLDKMITELKEEELHDLKKKKKHVREQKKKQRQRLANKLTDNTGDIGTDEQDLFSLQHIQNKKELETIENPDDDVYHSSSEIEFESDDQQNESDDNSSNDSDEKNIYLDDELYDKLPKRQKLQIEEKKIKKKKRVQNDNPLLVDLGDNVINDEKQLALNKAKEWYQKVAFEGVEESDSEMDDEVEEKEKSVINKKIIVADENDLENEDSESGDDSEIDDRSISQGKNLEKAEAAAIKENTENKKIGFSIAPQTNGVLGPEALALGTAMVTSKKRKRDIVDDAYNRYSFNDEGLPKWFIEDEVKHTVRHIPITREEVEFYKQRIRDLNARPIKKVIEAKAKKKSQMLKKLDRARRKAQGILDATDTGSREKQEQIKGIYKRAGLLSKKKVETTYVVAKKGLAGKKYSRPDGVKGQFKVVDPRMKKDLRAFKNKEKTKGRKKRR
uniref:Putative rRNA methyltransferase n=1 Tax=Hydra vulgaris TaxID=6087 RepID=T2MAG6_HYDVU|nr:pre-rRNA 2'-O-ribose RNA methyltransferase FTSJ3 [Hydra vulgaris]XP_047142102.1 pre-rRNA 2'-O-ribose RNA methyltransferase FTSJ3 [Hydra vulgaris]